MVFHKKVVAAMCVLCVVMMAMPIASAKKPEVKKILFVPHDSRPISEKQTVEVVEKLGYEVEVPPDNIMGTNESLGKPDELWQWMEANAKNAKAAVISSDTMLYGSLVGSRKHDYSKEKILQRAKRFQSFRKENPKMQIYVFGSIMRTPRSGEASGHMEPEYYAGYGADIFRYTALKDKEEVSGLSAREKKEIGFLQKLIPEASLNDWLGRRKRNLEANKYLIDLAQKGMFDYLVLGRDDNAPFSQTHMERRNLETYAKGLTSSKYRSMSGIDEVGMLLLSRAVNADRKETPFVYVRYNIGSGESTVPAYSDEKIGNSIHDAITVAGALQVRQPEQADLVLLVNTNRNGKTFEAADYKNDTKEKTVSRYFAEIISEHLEKGYPVALADIAYANGADNALMEELRKRGALFRLRSYSGWNTPTNSTGFAIGEGLLARNMKQEDKDELLLVRYLDDWAYQANIRNSVARQLGWFRGDGVYGRLDDKKQTVSYRALNMLKSFVKENIDYPKNLGIEEISFPWNRMFEADIDYKF